MADRKQIKTDRYWNTHLKLNFAQQYVRCFSSSKRFGLSENIFKNKNLQGDPVGCYRYYENLRDKHVAHSVNPLEQVVVLELSEPHNTKLKH